MMDAKPMRYVLQICFGGFDGDTAGFESSTPFVPLAVGDYIDHQLSDTLMAPSENVEHGQAFQVFAVKHSFQVFDSHTSQYVHVAVKVADVPR